MATTYSRKSGLQKPPRGEVEADILIAAQDLFFNAYTGRDRAGADQLPTRKVWTRITKWNNRRRLFRVANHSFVRFDLRFTVADLHWHVLATQSAVT